ncbi:ABC transporter ATP-binding protein [Oscillospiraceae bacterium NSJ-54]|uniref:ABC transporter ATP-binding protein n=2 Tax=Zongyangia hominis TaxID=2763677 RepID=A0A926ECI7_9FIRM|nr:ABC transporter ATP-binding protein [Zongyangia hominis]
MKIRAILRMMKSYRLQIAGIMALSLLVSAFSAITPFISQSMIDKGLVSVHIPHVIYCVVLLVLFFLLKQIIEYVQKKIEIDISNDVAKNLQMKSISHGMKIKSLYYKDQGIYKIISDAFFDINALLSIAQSQFLTIFILIFEIVGIGVGLYLLDWRLALCVTALIPIKYVLNCFLSKRAERISREVRDKNQAYHRWLEDVVQGMLDVKLWGLHDKKLKEYGELVTGINESSKRQILLQAKNNSVGASVEQVVLTGLYVVGAYLILGQRLTLGGLMAFLSFASYLTLPVTIFLQLRYVLQQIKPNLESLGSFFQMEEEGGGQLPPGNTVERIEFSHVGLELDGKNILQDVNFTLRRGEKTAIIGENGSGKSTLINLLLRLYEPTTGQILLDRVPISQYKIEDYRKLFGVVTQDIHLFHASLRDNICLDGAPLGEEARIPFCTDFINGRQEGYETQAGSGGAKLSGGERQKIALLRALHRDAKIFVLDEPTSNYDKESDEDFNHYIRQDTHDFLLVVTHRRDILDCMDQMIELQNGRIVGIIKKEGTKWQKTSFSKPFAQS